MSLPESGGKGGTALAFGNNTSDTRLVQRALRERWKIPEEIREILPAEMTLLLKDRALSTRERISAAKVLIEADRLNMEQEKHDSPATKVVEHHHTVKEEREIRVQVHGFLSEWEQQHLTPAAGPGGSNSSVLALDHQSVDPGAGANGASGDVPGDGQHP